MIAVGGGAAVLATTSWALAVYAWLPAYESGRIPVSHPAGPDRSDAPGVPCEWDQLAAYIGENGGCRQSSREDRVDIVILGDSHAEHLYAGLREALPTRNVALAAMEAPEMFGSRAGLDLAVDSILETTDSPTVLITRFWTRGPLHPEDQLLPLEHAVQRFSAAKVEVVLVDDVPDFPFPVSACMFRIAPVIAASLCDQSRGRVEASRSGYLADLSRIASAYPGTRVVKVGMTLCDEETCSMLSGDTVAYSDPDHLNLLGSRVFADQLVGSGWPDPGAKRMMVERCARSGFG